MPKHRPPPPRNVSVINPAALVVHASGAIPTTTEKDLATILKRVRDRAREIRLRRRRRKSAAEGRGLTFLFLSVCRCNASMCNIACDKTQKVAREAALLNSLLTYLCVCLYPHGTKTWLEISPPDKPTGELHSSRAACRENNHRLGIADHIKVRHVIRKKQM